MKNYSLHIEYNHPFVKHFFGVYHSADLVAEIVSGLNGMKKRISANEISAHFVATDVFCYEQTDPSIRLWIGEVPKRLMDFTCGKTKRIPKDSLAPG